MTYPQEGDRVRFTSIQPAEYGTFVPFHADGTVTRLHTCELVVRLDRFLRGDERYLGIFSRRLLWPIKHVELRPENLEII